MKKYRLLCYMLMLLSVSCKKNDRSPTLYLELPNEGLILPSSAGKTELTVRWGYIEWELTTSKEGFLSNFSLQQGGSTISTGTTRIFFNYAPNTTGKERYQDIIFKNRMTGVEQIVRVTQPTGPPTMLDVNTALRYQHVKGFGGMLNPTWTGDVQLNRADMDFLYGTGNENIGLNMIRMLIYPNSTNWDRDVEVALMAQASGARVFASPWTPPAYMKSNNSQLAGGHLLPEHYQDYVDHLNAFIAHMASKGLVIDAVSLQNEPDIKVSYDGCEWTVEEMHTFVRDYADQINAKVIAAESFNHKFTYTDAIMNDPLAVNNLDIVGGHLYGSRSIIRDYPLARANGKEVWITEYLMNDPSDNDGMGWDQALAFGDVVHLSMQANINAFVWWYMKRNYSFVGDGLLGSADGEHMKRGFVMGHYAKYATGRQRIAVEPIAGNNNLLVTGYEGEHDITLVLQNHGSVALETIQFNLPKEVSGVEAIETTETSNMVNKSVALTADKTGVVVNIGARSVVSIKLIK